MTFNECRGIIESALARLQSPARGPSVAMKLCAERLQYVLDHWPKEADDKPGNPFMKEKPLW